MRHAVGMQGGRAVSAAGEASAVACRRHAGGVLCVHRRCKGCSGMQSACRVGRTVSAAGEGGAAACRQHAVGCAVSTAAWDHRKISQISLVVFAEFW